MPVLMVILKSIALIYVNGVLNYNDWKFFEIGWLNLILCWLSSAAINFIFIPSVLLTGFVLLLCKLISTPKTPKPLQLKSLIINDDSNFHGHRVAA